MVDLVAVGVSGLAAYQRALATTGNNIANLQTDGYVRQRSSIESAAQDNTARISLGSGVRFAAVERLYDRYLEENLQRAGGDLKSQQALLGELQQLQDALGSSEAGLHGAFQAFFDSARALEASPASTGARAGFLAAAEGVAARFRGLASTAERLEGSTREQIQATVGEVNQQLAELATLNAQIIKRASASEQPMQLLDRRDALLKDLAERIGITVDIGQSGAATVYAGDSASGAALVENNFARNLSATFDPIDLGKVQFVLDAQSRPVVLPTITSGTLGGLVNFRGQGLGPSADKLDALAVAFGSSVNDIQQVGLDAQGRPGRDLFYIGPDYVVEGRANAGTGRLGVEVIDASLNLPRRYEARFDSAEGLWTVTDPRTGVSASGTSSVELAGLRFNFEGTPRDGDTFRITPDSRPAATLKVLIREPSEVASASKISAFGAISNLGAASADVQLADLREADSFRSLQDALPRTSGPPYRDTLLSATTRPIAVIEAGMQNVALRAGGTSGELAVFTRDGRQLSGPALTDAQAAAMLSTANGFYTGAVYSAAYRGQVGDSAYLDQSFVYGAYAEPATQRDAAGREVISPALVTGQRINSSAITALPANSLRLNGVALNASIAAGATVPTIAAAINAQKATTGVEVLARNEVRIAVSDPLPSGTQSLTIEGNAFSGASVPALLSAINNGGIANVSARLEAGAIVIERADGADLTINSGSIGGAPVSTGTFGGWLEFSAAFMPAGSGNATVTVGATTVTAADAEGLVAAINAQANSQTPGDMANLVATLEGDRIVLQNTSGADFTASGSVGDAAIPANSSGGRMEITSSLATRSVAIDMDPALASSVNLRQLGLSPGFAMQAPLAEDLLVFGVDAAGVASSISLSGTYEMGEAPAELATDTRQYRVAFAANNAYTVTDVLTDTVVSAGTLDTTDLNIRFGQWSLTLGGIPANGDTFTVRPTEDPLGDNRNAAAMARLQSRKDLLGGDATLQQEYESLVYRVGSLSVQAEVARNAQQVVYEHAVEARDRVSGVNLDEELADLLRFQQAYQANAQVIQTANRIFDALLQRL